MERKYKLLTVHDIMTENETSEGLSLVGIQRHTAFKKNRSFFCLY